MTTALGYGPVRGDPRLAEHLVGNLVDNAPRHNVAPGWIEVVTGGTEGRATLSIANTGPVIPESEISRLFQPFQRLDRLDRLDRLGRLGRLGRLDTDRTHNETGLGLGLSIVRAVVTAHDADITAHPRPGGGLRVTVTFPGHHA